MLLSRKFTLGMFQRSVQNFCVWKLSEMGGKVSENYKDRTYLPIWSMVVLFWDVTLRLGLGCIRL